MRFDIMSAILSHRLIGSFAVLIVITLSAPGAENSTKPNSHAHAAREQVAEALRAEVAGDNDRRAELLSGASRLAPDLPETKWHLGHVLVADKWLTLDEAAQQASDNSLLAEYQKLRDEAAENSKLTRGLAR